MPTTSNFGWTTPADTDLVKDGAAAIRTLGNGIDTSFLDLKGGTSGQVLSKNSNTDLDFTWVAQDDSNAIQNAIVDAKGDLISATAADTPARLAVGANGTVLTADSAQATGLKWVTPASGGKVLQVVSATYSTSTTIASTSFVDSGLSATITPTLNTSKILVMISQPFNLSRNSDQIGAAFKLIRTSTDILTADGEGIYTYVGTGANAAYLSFYNAISYLDSPATTSATTYKTQYKVSTTANSGQIILQYGSQTSSIILLEIGA